MLGSLVRGKVSSVKSSICSSNPKRKFLFYIPVLDLGWLFSLAAFLHPIEVATASYIPSHTGIEFNALIANDLEIEKNPHGKRV